MSNIKDKMKNIKLLFKKIFEKFPVTIFTIFIMTIIYTLSVDNELFSYKVLSNLGLFSVLFGCGSLFVETIRKDNLIKKISYYIISAGIAGILTYFTNIETSFLGIENSIFLDNIIRINWCYIISSILATIYIQFRMNNVSFEEYAAKVGTNIFKTSIVYGILSIGLLIITAIFDYLILNGNDYYLTLRVEILILGFFYLPRIIYSFWKLDSEIGKFSKVLIKYVLDILVIVAFVIIYLYIGKIIILKDIPSNQVFRIIASLFMVGCPIWSMASYFDDNTLLSKINRRLPLLFIPFILLQVYTIGVRIAANGVTEARYLCVLLILLEIVYIIMYLKSKEKIGNILLVFIVATIISSIVPYLNMFDVSKMSQINNLQILNRKSEYTQEDKVKIKGAYNYLKNISGGEKLISKLLPNKEEDVIKEFGDLNNKKDKIRLNSRKNISSIDVKQYSNIYFVNNYEERYNSNNIDKVLENVTLKDEKNESFEVDLSYIVKEYLKNREDFGEYFKDNNEVELDQDKKLIIEDIYVKYDEVTSNIEDFSLSGYLLVK